MDSKNAHSTVLKGPQLMNSSFVLNSIPASGSGKTCLPWVCAATLGGGAPEPKALEKRRAESRFWSLAKTKRKSNQSMLQDDRATAFVCARWHDFPTVQTNNILLSALLARHIHFGCSVAAQRRPKGQMEKQIQKAPDEIQFNSEMKQKLPTNANTARIPLLLGNYFWEMLVEETARSRPCGLHNSDPHILVGKNLVPKYTAHTKSHAIFFFFFSTCNISKKNV